MLKRLLVLFMASMCCFVIQSQDVDSSAANVLRTDSIKREKAISDSLTFAGNLPLINYKSPLLNTDKRIAVMDVQQYLRKKNNTIVFLVMLLLLLVITYVRIAFGNELTEMLMSVVNKNAATQLLRSQSGELSVASLLLHINFVFVMSLYVRFILVHYFNISSLENFSAILFLNFLFTFFYASKIVMMKLLGNVIELTNECNEYIFNFTTTCKTLGLTLIPALFVFYTAEKIIFDFVFVISIIICSFFALMFVWRGLSTSAKLLYRSVYHFFLYVWVIEISPIFLIFKLLTKTVT